MEGTYCWAASNSPAKVTAKLQERKEQKKEERERERGKKGREKRQGKEKEFIMAKLSGAKK